MPPPSRLCLSRNSSRGAPAPHPPPHSVARLPPARVGSPAGRGHPQHLHTVIWGAPGSPDLPHRTPRSNPRAQGRRAGIARATSCHRPSSPHHCARRGPGIRGRGARPPPALCCVPKPTLPGLRASRSRAPGPQPGGRHVAGPGARPPRPLWHSQWRRGCSCKLGPVRAAGAHADPEPDALPSERTTRR